MRLVCALGLWCIATAASWSATIEVLTGPWVLVRSDGGREVAIELPADSSGVADLRLALPGGVTLPPTAPRPLRRPQQMPTLVVAFAVPSGTTGTYSITGSGVRRSGMLTAALAPGATARVLIAGAGNWPEADTVRRAEAACGGAIDLVLASGPGLERVLGSGGWESSLPIALITSAPSAGERALAGPAIIVDGLRCGTLGLAVASDLGSAVTTLARDGSPWQVPVVPGAAWDPGVLAGRSRREPAALAAAVTLADRLHLPLVLATGGMGGAISEPLAVDGRGMVRFAAAGPRVIAATPGPQGLAALSPLIASTIPGPACVVVIAEPTVLAACIVGRDGVPPLTLRWPRAAEGAATPTANAWGAGEAAELLAPARGSDRVASAAAWRQLSWLARERLADWSPTAAEIAGWLASEASDATARVLLARCAAIVASFPGEGGAWTGLPPWLQHDLALRELAARHPRFDSGPLVELVSTGSDPSLLRAVLAALDDEHRQQLINLLFRRLARQAAGTQAIEAEPDLQHALVVAVFDAMHLSPTDLRPIALTLRPRLTPYSRGPIDRFLQRHGEVRPP